MKMKYCPKCKKDKELDLFHNNKNRIDGKSRVCKECQYNYDKTHYNKCKKDIIKRTSDNRKEYKKKFIEHKQTLKCYKCKDSRYYVLDFHHKDPTLKESAISNYYMSPKKLKEEIKKCIVLCSNCHREFHHTQRISKITLEEYLEIPK
jgi:hypothetical protein